MGRTLATSTGTGVTSRSSTRASTRRTPTCKARSGRAANFLQTTPKTGGRPPRPRHARRRHDRRDARQRRRHRRRRARRARPAARARSTTDGVRLRLRRRSTRFDYAGAAGRAGRQRSSLGGDPTRSPAELDAAIADAHPNTLFVVAAGNEGADDDDAGLPVYPLRRRRPPERHLRRCVDEPTTDRAGLLEQRTAPTSVDLFAPGDAILLDDPRRRRRTAALRRHVDGRAAWSPATAALVRSRRARRSTAASVEGVLLDGVDHRAGARADRRRRRPAQRRVARSPTRTSYGSGRRRPRPGRRCDRDRDGAARRRDATAATPWPAAAARRRLPGARTPTATASRTSSTTARRRQRRSGRHRRRRRRRRLRPATATATPTADAADTCHDARPRDPTGLPGASRRRPPTAAADPRRRRRPRRDADGIYNVSDGCRSVAPGQLTSARCQR